jgi:murein DD-endopeptidase MepM/ murein hydrolase activator NlpD
MSGVVNLHREESPALVSARPTIADLESGTCTPADLEAFVPETRAEARALQAAKAAAGLATVTAIAPSSAPRSRGARGTHRARALKVAKAAAASKPGSSFTRPRQAAALLVLTGALSAVQATAAQGDSGSTTATANASEAGISTLLAGRTEAFMAQTSRTDQRAGLETTTATPSAEAAANDAATVDAAAQAAELETRRAQVQQDQIAQKAAAEAAAAQAAAEAAAAQAAAEAAAAEAARFVLVAPVNAPVISGFGYRIHPVYGYSKMHTGLDYRVTCGVPVSAAEDGKVVESGWGGGYGNRVVIDHGMVNGRNLKTSYNHLSKRSLTVGMSVSKGDLVGLVGSTGTSTGCHLHFEVEQNGAKVNPAAFL